MNSPISPNDFEFITDSPESPDFSSKPISFFKYAAQRFIKNKAGTVSLIILSLIVLLTVFAQNSHGYNDQNIEYANLPPKMPVLERLGIFDGTRILYNRRIDYLKDIERYPEGSIVEIIRQYTVKGVEMCDIKIDAYKMSNAEGYFWFGTDYLGRDLWTRTWRGAEISLTIAVTVVLINLCIGVIYGAVAGYYGGKTDMLMMRFTEIIASFPQVIVASMIILVIGTGIKSIVIALTARGWISIARLVRSQFLRFKSREYILAARTMGANDFRIISKHILPNSVGPLITKAIIEIPEAIFSEAFLAFIGLGIQAPEPSIGVLLSDAQRVLISYPYQTFFPAILISTIMICFNLIGNSLRDAFNPTFKGA